MSQLVQGFSDDLRQFRTADEVRQALAAVVDAADSLEYRELTFGESAAKKVFEWVSGREDLLTVDLRKALKDGLTGAANRRIDELKLWRPSV